MTSSKRPAPYAIKPSGFDRIVRPDSEWMDVDLSWMKDLVRAIAISQNKQSPIKVERVHYDRI